MWYFPPMSIGWIIFWKALILGAWSEIQEIREKRKERGVSPSLVLAFKEEWDRRRAKQPLALTYRRSEPGETIGPVE